MSKFSILGNNSVNKVAQKSSPKRKMINIEKDFKHVMIVGQTGCGKTTSAILPTMDDRIKAGHGLLVFDYKGCEHKKVKFLADKHGRLGDVVMINTPWGEKINIIKEADEKQLRNFMQRIMKGSQGADFWTNMATNIATSSLLAIKSMHELKQGELSSLFRRIGFRKNYDPSFARVVEHTGTIEAFEHLYDDAKMHIEILENMDEIRRFCKINRQNPREAFARNLHKIKVSLRNLLTFATCASEFIGRNARQNQEQKDKFYGNYTFMLSSLIELASCDILNTDQNSITQLLNQGKIVIVNSASLNDNALALMLGSTLSRLALRQNANDLPAVSVFIDEAQRVINENTDLHADVLREARVELILAFQNESVLKNSIGGESKYNELTGNLTHKYFYKNDLLHFCGGKQVDFSHLKIFEYQHNGKIYTAKPMFLNEKEMLMTELKFQEMNNIKDRFCYESLDKNKILVYNKELLETSGLIECVDVENGIQRQCIFISEEDRLELEGLSDVA